MICHLVPKLVLFSCIFWEWLEGSLTLRSAMSLCISNCAVKLGCQSWCARPLMGDLSDDKKNTWINTWKTSLAALWFTLDPVPSATMEVVQAILLHSQHGPIHMLYIHSHLFYPMVLMWVMLCTLSCCVSVFRLVLSFASICAQHVCKVCSCLLEWALFLSDLLHYRSIITLLLMLGLLPYGPALDLLRSPEPCYSPEQ